jgi:hypothetical protein
LWTCLARAGQLEEAEKYAMSVHAESDDCAGLMAVLGGCRNAIPGADASAQQRVVAIAERCFAKLRDVTDVRYVVSAQPKC